MRIGLIGDIHLFTLKVHPSRLLGKRLLGQSNLWMNRRFRFNHGMLEPVINKVRELQLDLVLLSGDVTTTSLEDEFTDVVRYLKPLSLEVPVLVVPGNHDRYTYRSARKRRVETLLGGLMPERFPHFRVLSDRWRLMALDAAQPQIVMSRGALGKDQLAAAGTILEQLAADHGLIVLCHYPAIIPPMVPSSWAHDLAEARALSNLLAASRARIVYLHGHIHRPWYWQRSEDAPPPFCCLNAGSPCLTSEQYPLGQGFWLIELPENPQAPLGLHHYVPRLSSSSTAMTGEKRQSNGKMRKIMRRRCLPEIHPVPEWTCHDVL